MARSSHHCNSYKGQSIKKVLLGGTSLNRPFGFFGKSKPKELTDEEIVNDTQLLKEMSVRGKLVYEQYQNQVGTWLLICAGAVFGMIVLGGYTRLTKSGLSMTRWKPVQKIYPQTPEEWEKEFDQYKVEYISSAISRVSN